jgi:hypothetical protein
MSDWQSIRGDAASLPTDPMNMTFRPLGVTIVGKLIWVAAIWQAIVGVFAIIVAIFSSQVERFFNGQYLGGVSDNYLWTFGLLSIALSLIYVTIAKTLLVGDDFSRIVVIVLASLNLVFALFSFPWGVLAIIVNVTIIALLAGPKATLWFAQTKYQTKGSNPFM